MKKANVNSELKLETAVQGKDASQQFLGRQQNVRVIFLAKEEG